MDPTLSAASQQEVERQKLEEDRRRLRELHDEGERRRDVRDEERISLARGDVVTIHPGPGIKSQCVGRHVTIELDPASAPQPRSIQLDAWKNGVLIKIGVLTL